MGMQDLESRPAYASELPCHEGECHEGDNNNNNDPPP